MFYFICRKRKWLKVTLWNAILGKIIFETNDIMESVTKEIYESHGKGSS